MLAKRAKNRLIRTHKLSMKCSGGRLQNSKLRHENRVDDVLSSGYLADSEYESRCQLKGSKRPSMKASKIARKINGGFPRYRRNRSIVRIASNDGRSQDKSMDCSWIQRVFNNTPIPVSVVANKVTTIDDFSHIMDEARKKSKEEPRKQQVFATNHDPAPIKSGYSCQKDVSKVSLNRGLPPLSHSDNEEDIQVSALVKIVSGLLDECYEVQASYRSYFQHNEPQLLEAVQPG